MRYPEFLKRTAVSALWHHPLAATLSRTRQLLDTRWINLKNGYRTELGPNCYEGCGIGISNTPEKCGQELMEYYCNDTSDVLISCGGGELMCEDLPMWI